ncbi:hypothetical protein RQP46_004660 [Phenoliferia psychrophenolica]
MSLALSAPRVQATPLEVVAEILGWLRSSRPLDHYTLKQCSLVNSQWRTLAQRELFATVNPVLPTRCDRFLSAAKLNPALGSAVRTLGVGSRISSSQLGELLQACPLIIRVVSASDAGGGIFELAALPPNTRVCELVLGSGSALSLKGTALRSFPSIKTLILEGNVSLLPDHLTYSNTLATVLPSITSLFVASVSYLQWDTFPFAALCGPSLLHLSLGIDTPSGLHHEIPDQIVRDFQLEQWELLLPLCSALESLEVAYSSSAADLNSLLACLTHPHHRTHLTIHLNVYPRIPEKTFSSQIREQAKTFDEVLAPLALEVRNRDWAVAEVRLWGSGWIGWYNVRTREEARAMGTVTEVTMTVLESRGVKVAFVEGQESVWRGRRPQLAPWAPPTSWSVWD